MQDNFSTITRTDGQTGSCCKEEEMVYDINDYRADYTEEHPAVYVGTYGKYNEGSIYGYQK